MNAVAATHAPHHQQAGGGDAAFRQLAATMVETLRDGRIDEAENLYHQLCEMNPIAQEMLVFPVLIAIQRGQAMDALRYISTLPADRCPELRALCLQVLGDPTWYGEAMVLLESPDAGVRKAMQQLLAQ
jgi:type III secretion protein HrpB1